MYEISLIGWLWHVSYTCDLWLCSSCCRHCFSFVYQIELILIWYPINSPDKIGLDSHPVVVWRHPVSVFVYGIWVTFPGYFFKTFSFNFNECVAKSIVVVIRYDRKVSDIRLLKVSWLSCVFAVLICLPLSSYSWVAGWQKPSMSVPSWRPLSIVTSHSSCVVLRCTLSCAAWSSWSLYVVIMAVLRYVRWQATIMYIITYTIFPALC